MLLVPHLFTAKIKCHKIKSERRKLSMEYIVGKPRFKIALSYAFVCIVWSIVLAIANAWQGIRIFSLVLIIVVILIVVPGLSYSRIIWKVNQEQLCYTYHDTFFIKVCAFFKHILIDHHLTYQINLNLNQIEYITITYATLPRGPFNTYGYDILFEIHMYSGSTYTFDIFGLSLKSKDIIEAIDFMQNQGIRFVDKYCIIEALKKDTPISYYLESLQRGKKHD